MPKSLVIVESPAKARTIAAFLGRDYVVESSIGHIRDLPRRASDVPAALKKEKWARLGVDVDNDFKPLYILDPDKKTHIGKLKQLIKESRELYLATDEDREGESIAWHLLEVLKPRVPVKRMVFHEITKKAIEAALAEPRDIDRRLVDAQEARRILDRLYGYEVSPVLWKKVMPRLSAGRVQSVATRMVVARERDRIRFVAAGYWDIDGTFSVAGGELGARLASIDNVRLATGKDFDDQGKVKTDRLVLDQARAERLAAELPGRTFEVASLVTKPYRRSPSPPFMTSTLQQEAGRKLRFSAQRTMRAAQRLYESGYITYMRTDSTTLSDTAITAARNQISEMYGTQFMPESPRVYRNKVKNAQEAHEAIRPAGDSFKTPDQVAREQGPDESKIYELVWKRTLASQMNDAQGQNVQVKIVATNGERLEFAASGLTITFPGFLRAYVEGSDDPEAELENRERHLPPLAEGEKLRGEKFVPESHETQPPARYTEASLVRHLEELGVGRPSTYASILNTIVDRGYVWKKGTALVPSFKAFAVVTLLEQHFPDLVDYAFTARMEDELDQIASGNKQTVPWLHEFYFGAPGNKAANDQRPGLRNMVASKLEEIDARQINTLPLGKDAQGRGIAVRVGRFGPYLQREDDATANIPETMAPDELTLAKAAEMLETPSGDRLLGVDPDTGLEVFLKDGRFGAYVQLGDASAGKEKPKTSSLMSSMKKEELTLPDALKLLTLPRLIGEDAAGVPMTAHNGRYGPYVERGTDWRNLEKEDDLFTISVEQTLAVLAQPRKRPRREAPAPLRELGMDPVSEKLITLREGRFGPYVTDGETNASLRTGDVPELITPERAQELLQTRRDRGPAAKKTSRKKAAARRAPKAAAKKPPSPKASPKATLKAKPKPKAPKKKAGRKSPKKASAKKSAQKKSTAPSATKKSNGHAKAPLDRTSSETQTTAP